MNTTIIIHTRMALLLLTSWMIPCSVNAQEKIAAQPNCSSDVRPIKRVKPAAKPVSVDWTTLPSTFSHDDSGQRVDQFVAPVAPETAERPDYVRSGFRHTRSSLQAGFGADHYHVTEQWGQPVRPYGEWRYPNRPFSVPYSQWGPQLPQVVGGVLPWQAGPVGPIGPWNGNGGRGPRGPGQIGPGNPGQNPNQPNPNQPGMNQPDPFGQGQFGQGQFGQGAGMFGVGPNNVLPAIQDEYYHQAPFFHVPELPNMPNVPNVVP
ncbi:MAG: hypothetical protein ACOVQM_21780 [Pirellula sp.]|jgi:hypothetical protein